MIDVTVILGVFFAALDKKSELSCCFFEASSKIGRRIQYLQAKQRTFQSVHLSLAVKRIRAQLPCNFEKTRVSGQIPLREKQKYQVTNV